MYDDLLCSNVLCCVVLRCVVFYCHMCRAVVSCVVLCCVVLCMVRDLLIVNRAGRHYKVSMIGAWSALVYLAYLVYSTV
jgi:hypothetical protein